jgi:hypothetical protein
MLPLGGTDEKIFRKVLTSEAKYGMIAEHE